MIDNLGRMQASDMYDRVRRRLNEIQAEVDPTVGTESGATIQNQMISNTDILNKLNSVMVGLYSDIMVLKPEVFATEIPMDATAYNNTYAFPIGMIQFIALMWKDPSVPVQPVPGPTLSPRPKDYIQMVLIDDPHDYDDQIGKYPAPTFRRRGDIFQLNEFPTQNNPQGFLVVGVFLPPSIVDNLVDPDGQPLVVDAPYARLAQEVMIIDAARQLGKEKLQMDTTGFDEEAQTWKARLFTAVDNAQHPVSVQFTSDYLVKDVFRHQRRGEISG